MKGGRREIIITTVVVIVKVVVRVRAAIIRRVVDDAVDHAANVRGAVPVPIIGGDIDRDRGATVAVIGGDVVVDRTVVRGAVDETDTPKEPCPLRMKRVYKRVIAVDGVNRESDRRGAVVPEKGGEIVLDRDPDREVGAVDGEEMGVIVARGVDRVRGVWIGRIRTVGMAIRITVRGIRPMGKRGITIHLNRGIRRMIGGMNVVEMGIGRISIGIIITIRETVDLWTNGILDGVIMGIVDGAEVAIVAGGTITVRWEGTDRPIMQSAWGINEIDRDAAGVDLVRGEEIMLMVAVEEAGIIPMMESRMLRLPKRRDVVEIDAEIVIIIMVVVMEEVKVAGLERVGKQMRGTATITTMPISDNKS